MGLHSYSYAEYAALETMSPEKHEFFDGDILLLARGDAEHAALSAAIGEELWRASRSRGCAYSSELRIFVESVALATFADASVVFGPLQQHEPSPNATAVNPGILAEVTSSWSEEYDRGLKAEFYRTIPTLREYIIVSHRERRITAHVRGNDGEWHTSEAGPGGSVAIPSLGASLLVDAVYDGIIVSV
jgi:Uma2 family endonuclease